MRENVGGADRKMRMVVGPGLLVLGYAALGGNRGRLPGLLAMVAGVLVTETAITKVCPLNEALGIDTARMDFGDALPPRRHVRKPELDFDTAGTWSGGGRW
ncbi:MAG TPA: DUF2892 domain-containing protein [Longimicrobium sp.]|jgi:hypothetical protein